LNKSFAVEEITISVAKSTPVDTHVDRNGVEPPKFHFEVADDIFVREAQEQPPTVVRLHAKLDEIAAAQRFDIRVAEDLRDSGGCVHDATVRCETNEPTRSIARQVGVGPDLL
jgi:hypothetical protein